MRRKCILILIAVSLQFTSFNLLAQKKINGRVLKETKEWRMDGSKKKLDHITKYNSNGDKVEEIEYTLVGDQKSRVVYKYNEKGKCIEEQQYDEYNKLEKTLQFEYNEFGKKKSQKTILPNGKVKGIKEFEYILE